MRVGRSNGRRAALNSPVKHTLTYCGKKVRAHSIEHSATKWLAAQFEQQAGCGRSRVVDVFYAAIFVAPEIAGLSLDRSDRFWR